MWVAECWGWWIFLDIGQQTMVASVQLPNNQKYKKNAQKLTRRCASFTFETVETVETVATVETVDCGDGGD